MTEFAPISESELIAMVEPATKESIDATAATVKTFEIGYGGFSDAEHEGFLDVSFIEGDPNSKLLIIQTSPYTEHPARDFQVGRMAALSNETGASVLAISTPGLTNASPVTAAQKLGLVQASAIGRLLGVDEENSTFTDFGKPIADVASTVLRRKLHKDKEWIDSRFIVADFYSMGNNIGAAMLGHLPDDLKPDVVLWREFVDPIEREKLRNFQWRFSRHGAADFKRYHDANGDVTSDRSDTQIGGGFRAMRHPNMNLIYLPAGMAGASVKSDIKNGYQADGNGGVKSAIHVAVHGGASEMSIIERNEALIETIEKQIGVKAVGLTINEGTHGYFNHYDLNTAAIVEALNMAELASV